jgi:murein DD-endopeptidase MepM/ murein hydrolase activator NlpD
MAGLPRGAFERAANPGRRSIESMGLAGLFGQSPAQRRAQAPFGNAGRLGGPLGRSDFRGGLLGNLFGGRSPFGAGRSPLDFGGIFDGLSWDAKGIRQRGGVPGTTTGGASGGLSPNGATPYDQAFIDAAREMGARYGVQLDPAVLKAMANIESGGTFGMPVRATDDWGGGASVGMMQIKPEYWGGLAQQIGADIWDPVGNIRTGAAIMAQAMAQNGGSWERAIATVYHPGSDSQSGYSPDSYIAQVNQLRAQYGTGLALGSIGGALSGGSTWSGGVGSGWTGIFGPAGTPISYEFDAPTVNGDMYNYASASGMSGWSHPGIDVSVPRNTPLYSPGSGTVSCVGWGDAGIGGTGGGSCGYFQDSDGGGVGNVTIRLDNGVFVILGHSASANVQPGQRVNAGDLVAFSGGMYGAHTHLEVRVPDPSTPSGYRIVDPRTVLGGGGAVVTGGYSPAPQPQNSGMQAVNGAYYSPGYRIPSRLGR